MNWRERLADWISGGALTFHKNGWERSNALYRDAKEDAEHWRVMYRAVSENEQAHIGDLVDEAVFALRAILGARNITEARKIARQALGEQE